MFLETLVVFAVKGKWYDTWVYEDHGAGDQKPERKQSGQKCYDSRTFGKSVNLPNRAHS